MNSCKNRIKLNEKNIGSKIIFLILIFVFIRCSINPSIPPNLKTKLVLYCVLSNNYKYQVVYVDTITHISTSFYKEFLKPISPDFSGEKPGISNAEVFIIYNNEVSKLNPFDESNIEYFEITPLKYYQGYYCDYNNRVNIKPGVRYDLFVKYKDMEVTSETVIPEKFDNINISLNDSLFINWKFCSPQILYHLELSKYCRETFPYSDPFEGFSIYLKKESYNNYISFGIEEIENRFKNSKYITYFSDDLTGRYKIIMSSLDKNFYNFREKGSMNIKGGLGLFGSMYIVEKEFEIIENNGKYEIK